MNPEQRVNQKRAIAAQYRRMFNDGEIEKLAADADASRYLWASQVIGRVISTLDACEDWELNALRDTLNGKPPKLLDRANAEFIRLGIRNPDSYIAKLAESVKGRYLLGHTVATLPMKALFDLCRFLETRTPAPPSQHAFSGPRRRFSYTHMKPKPEPRLF